MKRRDFVKYAGGSIATLFVGSMMPSWISEKKIFATQVQELNFYDYRCNQGHGNA